MLERGHPFLVEGFKSMLIVLLAVSAVFLAGQAFMPYGGSGEEGAESLLPVSSVEPLGSVGVARPVRMAVVNDAGRCGAQYDDTAVDELFDALGDLLGEGLDLAGEPVPVSRQAWEQALERRGVYYDFPGIVSLELLSGWLGAGETGLTAQVGALILAADTETETVRLYYQDAAGDYSTCETDLRFWQRLDSCVPNGAFFAFQMPERYSDLDPDTLLLPETQAPAIYKSEAGADVEAEEVLKDLLDALRFEPQPNAVYPAADGWTVRESEDSLRLTREGNIYYHGGENSDRYPVFRTAGETELVEVTGELVRRAMAPYSGAARIYLDSMEQMGESWVLTYRYSLSGADVQLGQEGWCARFTVRNGQICDYVLKLRCYTETAERAVLLPEYQAMYAMKALGAEGRQLLLRYYDAGGGSVSPAWIAR